ncbi:hypothetical protein PoB_002936300 [Plakobranchus ocellatus]|uniref:Uncharacterized protein n=1 Tax=Plakobranchus ocellatus TaxID=259542 RepID=A0AAV4A6N9_9GAST|nr:hypothetical protein PoB_002936300 [Plakobranchus ocellatus]
MDTIAKICTVLCIYSWIVFDGALTAFVIPTPPPPPGVTDLSFAGPPHSAPSPPQHLQQPPTGVVDLSFAGSPQSAPSPPQHIQQPSTGVADLSFAGSPQSAPSPPQHIQQPSTGVVDLSFAGSPQSAPSPPQHMQQPSTGVVDLSFAGPPQSVLSPSQHIQSPLPYHAQQRPQPPNPPFGLPQQPQPLPLQQPPPLPAHLPPSPSSQPLASQQQPAVPLDLNFPRLPFQHDPSRYEIEMDKSKTAAPMKKPGTKTNNMAAPAINVVYEYDFVEPPPPATPRPVYNPSNYLYNMVQPKAHIPTQHIKPQNFLSRLSPPSRHQVPVTPSLLKPIDRPTYPSHYIHSFQRKPTQRTYPSANQIAALRLAFSRASRRRQAMLRNNVIRAPPPPVVPRVPLTERQTEATPLYSNYPLRTVISAAAARGITCQPLYDAYRLLPMRTYSSYCGRGLSCPSHLSREVQVGLTCLCCSSFGWY